jgi:tetratricopeptide (TPR) repeat protein
VATLAEDFTQLTEYEPPRARRLLHAVVAEMPRSAEAQLLLAWNYLRSLEFETALAHFREAASLDGNAADRNATDRNAADRNATEARSHVGFCLIALGRYEEAPRVFNDVAALVAPFVRLIAARGLFAEQNAAGSRHVFVPELFGLDVLLDRTGRPWLLEMQRKPAAGGAPLVNRVNGELFQTILRMQVGALRLNNPTEAAMRGRNRMEQPGRLYPSGALRAPVHPSSRG